MEYDKLPSRGKATVDGEETRKCGCGGRCYVFYDEERRYRVECENCGTVVNYKTHSLDMAIKLWNDMPTALVGVRKHPDTNVGEGGSHDRQRIRKIYTSV